MSGKGLLQVQNGRCTMKLPEDVSVILQKLNEKQFEAYIVGGCVRDCLLGTEPKDWDVTTSALPHEIKMCFPNTFDTGIQHGTVTVVLHKVNYEVTTYRIDGEYGDGRHPDTVLFTANLREDLRRRDFTMNAIAYHPHEGLIDPYGGEKDIQQKCIRGVGNPAERFQEDALRMLRAVRFAAQLGFVIESDTYKALQENCKLIQKVSVERIREELQKLLLSVHIEQLPLLWNSGLLIQILPALAAYYPVKEKQLISQLKQCRKDSILVWTLFLQYCTKQETESLLKYLKFDTKSLRFIVLLQDRLKQPLPETPYQIRKETGQIGIPAMQLLLELKDIIYSEGMARGVKAQLADILKRREPMTISDLKIDGNELMALGVKKGREIGVMLSALLELVLENPENNDPCILKEFVIQRIH